MTAAIQQVQRAGEVPALVTAAGPGYVAWWIKSDGLSRFVVEHLAALPEDSREMHVVMIAHSGRKPGDAELPAYDLKSDKAKFWDALLRAGHSNPFDAKGPSTAEQIAVDLKVMRSVERQMGRVQP